MQDRHPKRLRRAAAAAAVALAMALALSAGSARAEDPTRGIPLDSNFWRQFMKDLGLRTRRRRNVWASMWQFRVPRALTWRGCSFNALVDNQVRP